jgi:SanA protein
MVTYACTGLIILLISWIFFTRTAIVASTKSRIMNIGDSNPAPVAIVFGAGLQRNGSPTPLLEDRVTSAAQLYFDGKVEKLLLSGDNRFFNYNEPGAMKAFAMRLGVPENAIVLDYAGRRTYDTCYRAKAIFGVTKAILVTQNFHLYRAIFLCSKLDLDVTGVSADRRKYTFPTFLIWEFRELLATGVAVLDIYVLKPIPVLGNEEPIFPSSTSKK